jgi:8-oxo-dGTP pyrophosphatase MutT (NUDIX family)
VRRVLSARVLFLLGDHVLLANRRGETWFYLPGGNVGPGESIEAALRREMKEETGLTARSLDFVGTVEHIYTDGDQRWHEVNLVFAADVPRFAEIGSRQEEIDVSAVAVTALHGLEFRPPHLGEVILDWVHSHRPELHGPPSSQDH